MNDFCVYFRINPLRNEIYYVGKGRTKRAYDKEDRSSFWKNTFKKYGRIVDIAHTGLTESEAWDLERFYIGRIGTRAEVGGVERRGPLVNLTAGGEGSCGHPRSPESIEKSASFHRGRKRSKDTIERMSASQRGVPKSRQAIENSAAAQRGKTLSADHRKKISESGKARWARTKKEL